MEEFDYDEMENSYSKAVLNKKKKKEEKNINSNKKIDEKKVLLLAIIISAIIITLILSIININFKEKGSMINTELVDKVNYIEKVENEGINPEDMVSNQNENQNNINDNSLEESNIEMPEESLSENDKAQVKQDSESTSNNVLQKYYAIQVGASGDLDLVNKKISEIENKGYSGYYLEEGTKKYMYKILIDKKFETRKRATDYAKNLKDEGIISDFWVRYFNE